MTQPSQTEVDAKVREMFGEVAAFLTHPELGPILRQAATEGWDSTRLFGKLQQTTFWQTTGDTARKWTIVQALDPATAQEQRAEQRMALWDLANAEGFMLSSGELDNLTNQALQMGWSTAELRAKLYESKQGTAGSLDVPVTARYGYLAAFLDEPEVGDLLRKAAAQGWTPQRLEASLITTNFWRRTTEAQRQFDALREQSPVEHRERFSSRLAEINALAESLGINLPNDRLHKLGYDSIRFGWEGERLRLAVSREFDYKGGEGGVAGQSAARIKELSGQYLVPVSDSALANWTERIVRGESDETEFKAYLVEQAKSLFPGMAEALDKGVTVAQYADPYKQIAARELEVAPESVDLNDPRFRKMLDQQTNGQRTAMTLSQATEYLRTLPEWQKTAGANEKAAQVTEKILQTFGATA